MNPALKELYAIESDLTEKLATVKKTIVLLGGVPEPDTIGKTEEKQKATRQPSRIEKYIPLEVVPEDPTWNKEETKSKKVLRILSLVPYADAFDIFKIYVHHEGPQAPNQIKVIINLCSEMKIKKKISGEKNGKKNIYWLNTTNV